MPYPHHLQHQHHQNTHSPPEHHHHHHHHHQQQQQQQQQHHHHQQPQPHNPTHSPPSQLQRGMPSVSYGDNNVIHMNDGNAPHLQEIPFQDSGAQPQHQRGSEEQGGQAGSSSHLQSQNILRLASTSPSDAAMMTPLGARAASSSPSITTTATTSCLPSTPPSHRHLHHHHHHLHQHDVIAAALPVASEGGRTLSVLTPSTGNDDDVRFLATPQTVAAAVQEQQQQQQQQQQDVDMMPLDLSFRSSQREDGGSSSNGDAETELSRPHQTYTPENLVSGGGGVESGRSSLKHGGSSQSYSRSHHRLSPYHLFSMGLARSPAAPNCLPVARSPHSRSNSPFYQLHRQTPSPYYNSCLNPHGSSYYSSPESSSSQVISTTNRVLNGLAGSTGVFRPYEDHNIPTEGATPPLASRRDVATPKEDPEEIEEPTYYDLDSSMQKQVAEPGRDVNVNVNGDTCRTSQLYRNHQPHVVTSLGGSPPHYFESNASPHVDPTSVHNGNMMAFSYSPSSSTSSTSLSSASSLLSTTSSSSSSPCSTTPPTSLLQPPPPPFISQEVSSQQAHCDLTHQSVRGGACSSDNNSHTYLPYSASDEAIQKSNNQAAISHKAHHPNAGNNMHVAATATRNQQQQYINIQQPDPDSSSSSLNTAQFSPSCSQSSPPAVAQGIINSSSSPTSTNPTSPRNSSSSLEYTGGLQHYPDCDRSVTSTGTIVSNKENLRESQVRPQSSFFRAPDKEFMEQTCRILAEKHKNEGANRMSLLDFWISKIRIAATQSHKSNNICQNVGSRSKIKIRMVELMELQVEQSLRYDWR